MSAFAPVGLVQPQFSYGRSNLTIPYNELLHGRGPEAGGFSQDFNYFSLGSKTFGPGDSLDPHFHAGQHEVVVMVRGELLVTVGSANVTMRAGDKVVLEPGVIHGFLNRGAEWAEIAYLKFPPNSEDVTWV